MGHLKKHLLIAHVMNGPPGNIKMRRLKEGFLDVADLVRSLQRGEGNMDCFRRAAERCDQLECAWRAYCFEDRSPAEEKTLKLFAVQGK